MVTSGVPEKLVLQGLCTCKCSSNRCSGHKIKIPPYYLLKGNILLAFDTVLHVSSADYVTYEN